jgi:hypothetical protein
MLDYQRHVGIHRVFINDEMPVATESFAYVPNAIAGSLIGMCFVEMGPYHSSHTVVDGLNGSSICLSALLVCISYSTSFAV